jgi:hypothetical protein
LVLRGDPERRQDSASAGERLVGRVIAQRAASVNGARIAPPS